MSGVAVFGLKFPSLLEFDEGKKELVLKHNLRKLYHLKQAPSDNCMGERCNDLHDKNGCVNHYNQCHIKIQGYFFVTPSEYKKTRTFWLRTQKNHGSCTIDHERKILKCE